VLASKIAKGWRRVLFMVACYAFVSCNVEKRVYLQGFHVDVFNVNKKASDRKKPESNLTLKKIPKQKNEGTAFICIIKGEFNRDSLKVNKANASGLPKDSCNDIILFRNGEQIKAKVIEIGESEIQYQICDTVSGSLTTVSTAKLKQIKYSNGVSEIFEEASKINILQKKVPEKQMHPDAKRSRAWLISSVFTGIFGLIIAYMYAEKAEEAINREPEKYSGKEIVKISKGIVKGLIGLTLLFFVVLVVLFAVFIGQPISG
jgi:hypothetical protein